MDCTEVDSVRERANEEISGTNFPELGSVDVDEATLEYLIRREEFERQHPSKKARQVTNKAAWMGMTVGNSPVADATPDTTPGFTKEPAKAVESSSVAAEEIVHETSSRFNDSDMEKESDFAIGLDESQLKALEEIRAQRERRKNK